MKISLSPQRTWSDFFEPTKEGKRVRSRGVRWVRVESVPPDRKIRSRRCTRIPEGQQCCKRRFAYWSMKGGERRANDKMGLHMTRRNERSRDLPSGTRWSRIVRGALWSKDLAFQGGGQRGGSLREEV